ncbi:MAG: hypothetical protein J1F38_10355 [Muribaculaceae bacterium]|nr:hypothetical protein [Muribaculaceae bacterium]
MTKNILKYLSVAIIAVAASSCAKEEIGGTAVQDMCGEWYILVDGVDADGNVVYEDPLDLGYTSAYTYNTNANLSTEMYLEDYAWEFFIKVDVDYPNRTFSVKDAVMYYDEDENGDVFPVLVNILNGKVVKDGALSAAGYVTDGISYLIQAEDDPYAAAGYWDYLWVHGYRRTGLMGGND